MFHKVIFLASKVQNTGNVAERQKTTARALSKRVYVITGTLVLLNLSDDY